MRKAIITLALAMAVTATPAVAVADDAPPPPDVCMTQRAYTALMARKAILTRQVNELTALSDAQAEAIARKDARIDRKNERIAEQARLIKRLRAQLAD